MKTIQISSNSHPYNIYLGSGLRFQLKTYLSNDYSSILVITDENVAKLYVEDVIKSLSTTNVRKLVLPAGESTKNIETYYSVQTKAIEYGLDRHSVIIALGGGVIGDLAGFVAATFMRGIDYIQMPTTILAHDSSIGGKVAINHELGKNLIGSFYPPKVVYYDVDMLHTLPIRERRSGYAELIKEALLADELLLEELLKITLEKINNETIISHLEAGINVKATIVKEDEKERGIRKYLNLGHTMGHALEAIVGYGKLTHGEAVAIGLLFALYVSEQYFTKQIAFKKLYHWFHMNEYPLTLEGISTELIVEKMKFDKKVIDQEIKLVLLKKIGQPVIYSVDYQEIVVLIDSFLNMLNRNHRY